MIMMWIAVGIWAIIVAAAMSYGFATAQADVIIKPHCHGCGQVGHIPLRYHNIKSGAHYCSQECVEKDPNWPDDSVWIGN